VAGVDDGVVGRGVAEPALHHELWDTPLGAGIGWRHPHAGIGGIGGVAVGAALMAMAPRR
jgi:hypothetical protein